MIEIATLAGLWLAFNLFVTRRVLTIGKLVQLPQRMLVATIWLLPFIGALMALGNNTPSRLTAEGVAEGETLRDRSGEYDPPPTALTSAEGGEFSVVEHLQQGNGLPVLDWRALADWAPGSGDGTDPGASAARADAIERGRHAWLLHLREPLGPQGSPYTPHELLAMHLDHWDPDRIQSFWTGDSFLSSEENSALLSYELARIIVEQMARDWSNRRRTKAGGRTLPTARSAQAARSRRRWSRPKLLPIRSCALFLRALPALSSSPPVPASATSPCLT